MAVSAVSATDVWAVGTALGANDSTLAAHWDGHTWQVVTTPCLNGTKIILQEDACQQSQQRAHRGDRRRRQQRVGVGL